ncbi:MAG TPA: Xaa-Pro peptidase family protein [Spirochaetota bacterium]|nr:Xaa-Pro peptidase family protein [Spirochaetota bacterium]
MFSFPYTEFSSRLNHMKNFLSDKGISAAVFNQPSELYYYSGSVIPLYLVIPAEGDAFILARKGDQKLRESVLHMETLFFSGSKDLQKIWSDRKLDTASKIGFTLDSTSYSSIERIIKLSPSALPYDLSWDARFLRMKKTPAEIEIMKQGGKIAARIPEIVKENFTAGMTELEISLYIENFFRLNKSSGLNSKQEALVVSPGVCSSGINTLSGNKFDGICSGKGISHANPFGASDDVIKEHDPIIFDYAFILEGYHLDITRMASIGKPSDKVQKAYQAMLTIHKEIISMIKPGVIWEDVFLYAEKRASDFGYSNEFMGLGSDKVRFVGHGVGLLLDEPPFLAPKMKYEIAENMTIAIEPKVSLEGIGVVGIEDTILVTKDGAEIITPAPYDYIIL